MLFGLAWIAISVQAQDPLSDILREELMRNMKGMSDEEVSPYFMSYRVNDIKTYRLRTSFGQVIDSGWDHSRKLAVHVRVGSPELDNTHPLRGRSGGMGMRDTGADLPLNNEVSAVRQILWRETDRQYNQARDLYARVLADNAIRVEREDSSNDFTVEEPVIYYEEPLNENDIAFDISEWEERLKAYSAVFLDNEDIVKGGAVFMFSIERKYFVSSEGNSITENRLTCRIFVSAEAQAEDGMELPMNISFFGFEPGDLPEHQYILAEAKEVSRKLSQLRDAPLVGSYTGPALLAPESAGVFFHEIFGHRVEGHRLKQETDAQTFKEMVDDRVLNENLSVIFDPSMERYDDFYLNGSYKFDCEGQRGQRVVVVEDGMLRSFLMSRTPIEGFDKSNGHGRAQAGFQTVSRQSNLIVETRKPYTEDQLREMLLEEAKKQGRDYGYYFVKTVGGFTMTGRFMPNAFNVTPIEVYRIYVDGREDELVRGVDLVGTPLAIFSNIEAAGDTPGIFTGTCGAESGGVPTSTVSPMVFVRQIETQRKPKGQERQPI
ncbi:MAG: TldD/PmbA family protein, partial [Bacteroidia bacterium]